MRLAAAFTLLFFVWNAYSIDLTGDEYNSLESNSKVEKVTGKQWYDRFDISGEMASGLFTTRGTGVLENDAEDVLLDNHPYVDGTLWIEAEAMEDVSMFLEMYVTGTQSPWFFNKGSPNEPINIGESYIHFKNLLKRWGDDLLSAKIGTFDLPFGEEYVWQDRSLNPLILKTAAWPWAWDQGVMLYGTAYSVGWVFTVTDGSYRDFKASDEHTDDNGTKAYNVKVYGNVTDWVYLSFSWMLNDEVKDGNLPALWLGNNSFPTSAGDSDVTFDTWELNTVINATPSFDIAANYGILNLNDIDNSLDRVLTWYMIQPQYWVHQDWYVIARYSFYGSNFRYKKIDGDPFQSTTAFRDDLLGHKRYQVGFAYKPNNNFICKFEYAIDKFDVTEGAAVDPSNDRRSFLGFETAIRF